MRLSEYLIKRNSEGNLFGITKCQVCQKEFEFEENKNSEAVVDRISIEPDLHFKSIEYIGLDMISKCTNCGYRIKHYQTEINKFVK